ncbi:MAG: hypothetical protein RIC35_04595 [Marinoscillum sp.]
MLRVVNFLKVLSIILFLAILLLVYAYSPVMVNLFEGNSDLQLNRETFFYFGITVFVVINIVLLAFQKLFEKNIRNDEVRSWVRGLGFVINIYLTLIVGFIGVLNNGAHLSAAGFAYLNYLGPFLIFSWICGLFYLLYAKR